MKNLRLALSGIGLSAVMLLTACGNEVENVDYVHGTVEGNKFSTEMFGLTAEFDDSWTFASDEELAAMNQLSDMSAESTSSAFKSTSILYEMYVGNESGSNISFLIEELPELLDEQDYVDISYPPLQSQLEEQGFTVDNIEKTTVTFAGKETPCIKMDLSVMGINFYEYQVYKKAGQYMGVITITGLSKEETEELAGKFKVL